MTYGIVNVLKKKKKRFSVPTQEVFKPSVLALYS